MVANSGRSASSGLRDLAGVAARIIRVEAPDVEDVRRQEDRRKDLDVTGREPRPSRPCAFAAATESTHVRPERREAQTGSARDLRGEELPSTRSAGCTRSGRHDGGVATNWPCPSSLTPTSTLQPTWVRRRAAVPLGYVTPATRSGRSISMRMAARGATSPTSVRTGSIRPPAISTSRAAARSTAASGIAGSTDALETLARLTRQLVPARRLEDCERIPGSSFEEDVRRCRSHLGGCAAHDGSQRDDSGIVGDDNVFGIERAFDVVERRQLLPHLGATDHQVALHGGRIERVQRLAEFEHHVVGDVDGRRDRANTREQKSTLQPPRAHCLRIDTRDLPHHETRSLGLRFEAYRPGFTPQPGAREPKRDRRIRDRSRTRALA